MSIPPYFIRLFINYECPICFCNDKDIYTSICGHVICGECILNLQNKKKCYKCRKIIEKKPITNNQSTINNQQNANNILYYINNEERNAFVQRHYEMMLEQINAIYYPS